ncbi:reverse transcriptase [Gossypium australe]|uniref:Reverse transcriptase n=1 Tax=Gossypium australe TaxID=47621 RepID=A0A5B6VTV6_9ROSI|nr:reverse transcriptase [Gossypium australe]
MPDLIISDRDKIFDLFRQAGTKLLLSTAYHPQTDGQTEVLNRSLENYLRCMTGEMPTNWLQWLPLAEWWYNSSYHSSIQLTPYEALSRQPPPSHLPYLATSSVAVVDRSLQAREAAMKLLYFHIKRAQSRMKQFANKHRSERSFQVGDFVYLRLQAYRQQTVRRVLNQKLSPKYYGPFPVIKKVGEVAYTLQLPPDSRIHPTFHVSQLKKHVGSKPTQAHYGAMQKEPVRIVDRRIVKKGNQAITEVLVKWIDSFPEDATRESLALLRTNFPHFHP